MAQERTTKKVLMLAYANREALELTIRTGFSHYYSRSRGRLWKNGEESGNTQRVRRIGLDCDRDALIYEVDQTGPACHTGNETCFYSEVLPPSNPSSAVQDGAGGASDSGDHADGGISQAWGTGAG